MVSVKEEKDEREGDEYINNNNIIIII